MRDDWCVAGLGVTGTNASSSSSEFRGGARGVRAEGEGGNDAGAEDGGAAAFFFPECMMKCWLALLCSRYKAKSANNIRVQQTLARPGTEQPKAKLVLLVT